MQPAEIGARLRAAREGAELSREELAARLRGRGLTTATNTVLRWEKTGSLKASELVVAAHLLGADPCYLLTGSPGGPEFSGRDSGPAANPDAAAELLARREQRRPGHAANRRHRGTAPDQ